MIQTEIRIVLLALCAVIGLGGAVTAVQINDFDSDVESWRFDFGGMGTLAHDPSEGSPGNAPGALRLEMNFNLDSIAFTGDVFASPGIDLTSDTEILFDVKIDPNSALDAFGNHGYLDFVSRETDGYTWGAQPGRNLVPAAGWQTFSLPTTPSGSGLAMTSTRAFTFQLYGGPAQNISGNVTVWLDNIRSVPEPNTAIMALVTAFAFLPLRRRYSCR